MSCLQWSGIDPGGARNAASLRHRYAQWIDDHVRAGAGEVLAGALAVQATDDVTLNGNNGVATLGAVNTGSGQ